MMLKFVGRPIRTCSEGPSGERTPVQLRRTTGRTPPSTILSSRSPRAVARRFEKVSSMRGAMMPDQQGFRRGVS